MAKRGVNKVILVGNLGKEPELRATQNGNFICGFSVATSESWNDKQGQQQDRTEWHNIKTFGKLAEICGKYLQKGSKVYLEGQLRTNKWQVQDGSDRYTTEVHVNEMQMLDSRHDGQQSNQGYQNQQNPTYHPSQNDAQLTDDEIPF